MAVQSSSVESALKRRVAMLEKERDALYIAMKKAQDALSAVHVGNPANRMTRDSLRFQIIRAMESVLTRADRPMHREDIRAAVEAQGIPVRSIQTIADYLSKSGRFKNEGQGVWSLR